MSLLNADEAGEILGVPGSWCLREARYDRIPHVRLGKYVRFDRDELEEFRRNRSRGPRSRA